MTKANWSIDDAVFAAVNGEPTPWGEAELERQEYAPNNVSQLPTAHGQEQAAEESIAAMFNRLSLSADELDAMELPDPEWIVPGILTEGLGMIAAAPKIGKSWFAYDLGLAVAMGGKALGCIDVKQRPVLYFALEDNERRLKKRMRILYPDAGKMPHNFRSITQVSNLDHLIVLAQHWQDINPGQAPLIMLDTLGRVSPGKQASQSQYEADYSTGAKLQEMLAKRVPGSAVLVVHHTNKGAHDDFLDGISGTQGVAGAYDTALVLTRNRQSDEGILQLTGRDIENETEYALRTDGGKWSLIGGSLAQAEAAAEDVRENAKTSNMGDRSQDVLKAVRTLKEGDAVSPFEIAQHLQISNDDAGKYLRRLLNKGVIVREGRGRYAPS